MSQHLFDSLGNGLFPEPDERHPLIEPSLFYDPPYARALDDTFAWHLVKYLKPISGLLYQEQVELPHDQIRIDFVVEQGPRRIGFMLGGSDRFESEQDMRLHDALIVGAGALDVLFRLRDADVQHHLHEALLLVAHAEPSLFSRRGRINLNTLAAPEARGCFPRRGDTDLHVIYKPVDHVVDGLTDEVPEPPEAVPSDTEVHWYSNVYPEAWMVTYEHALTHYGISPDAWSRRWARSA